MNVHTCVYMNYIHRDSKIFRISDSSPDSGLGLGTQDSSCPRLGLGFERLDFSYLRLGHRHLDIRLFESGTRT